MKNLFRRIQAILLEPIWWLLGEDVCEQLDAENALERVRIARSARWPH